MFLFKNFECVLLCIKLFLSNVGMLFLKYLRLCLYKYLCKFFRNKGEFY